MGKHEDIGLPTWKLFSIAAVFSLFLLPGSAAANTGDDTATVQDPAKRAFVARGDGATNGTPNAIEISVAQVPAKTRLVIETMAVTCSIAAGANVETAFLKTLLNGFLTVDTVYYFILQKQGSSGGVDSYVGTFTGRIYADPVSNSANDVRVAVSTDSGFIDCFAIISGYTVPNP